MPIHIPDTSLHSTPAPSFIRDLITTPGDLKYDIDLTSSVHPFVEQYLRDVPQRLVSSGASPLWCNTTVAAGTTATVILYAPYVNGESMGCYNTDWPSGAKTVVLGKGVLSFSSTTGKFESSGWTDLKDKDGNPVILNVTPTSESDDFDGNALVFFSTAWKDVIDDSKAQKASYTDFQRAVIGAFS